MKYIIVGDTERNEGCLVRPLGASTRESAERMLAELLTSNNKWDIMEREKHTNLRVKEVPDSNACWNDARACN